jgi:proteasome lid subunit RPN8/RPN11
MQQTNLAENEIIWEESDDVYKPIVKSIHEFRTERDVKYHKSQVYIKKDALNNLTKHLESNLRVEQGGILFGNAYQDPDSEIIYVEIIAAVAAPATIGTGSHLEFTSNSWLGIMEYARKEHPEENIVGWYHSHPNIGVFMSRTDMRTQQAFFYHPWCLSIVCDPVREEIGFFLGKKAISYQPVFFNGK